MGAAERPIEDGTPAPPAPPRRGAEREVEWDALRGLAIATVVALHVSWRFVVQARTDLAPLRMVGVTNLLLLSGVPMFITLSALGLARRYGRPFGYGREFLAFLAGRARRLLPAYVVWSVVSAALQSPARLWPPGRIVSLLVGGQADQQFYFIPLIFELYVVWPLLQHALRWTGASPPRSLALALAGSASMVGWWQLHPRLNLAGVFADTSLAGVIVATILQLGLWIGFVTLGMAVAPHVAALRNLLERTRAPLIAAAVAVVLAATALARAWLATAGAALSLEGLTLTTTLFQVPHASYAAAVVVFALLAVLVPGRERMLEGLARLGRHSYGVFLVHLLVLRLVVQNVVGRPEPRTFDDPTWPLLVVLHWLLTLVVSGAVVAGLARVSWLRWLVGSPPVAPATAHGGAERPDAHASREPLRAQR